LTRLLRKLVGRNRTLIVATHDEDFARATGTRIVNVTDGVTYQDGVTTGTNGPEA
jgi:ABC-type polar amino acid transport system ATPase subunit